MGSYARELGGTTFYGGSIDGRVLWGKFKGQIEKLKDDLAARTGLEVELTDQGEIEPITLTMESTASTEEDLGNPDHHVQWSARRGGWHSVGQDCHWPHQLPVEGT